MARHDKPYSVLLGIVFQPVFFLKNWELSMGTLESSKPHWRNMANFFSPRWWFQTFSFIFTSTCGRFPFWLFFKWWSEIYLQSGDAKLRHFLFYDFGPGHQIFTIGFWWWWKGYMFELMLWHRTILHFFISMYTSSAGRWGIGSLIGEPHSVCRYPSKKSQLR